MSGFYSIGDFSTFAYTSLEEKARGTLGEMVNRELAPRWRPPHKDGRAEKLEFIALCFPGNFRGVWEVGVDGNRIQSDRIHAEWLVSYISTLNQAEESTHRGHPVCPGVRLGLLIPEAKVLMGKTPLMPFAPSPFPAELMCFLVGFSAVREFGFSRPIFADTKQTFLKHPLLPEESGFRDLLFVHVFQLTLFSGAPE